MTVRGYFRLSPEGYNGPSIPGALFARRSVPLFAADSAVEISQYNGLGFAVTIPSPAAKALPPMQKGTYLAITGRLACKGFNPGIQPTAITVVRRA